jgi:hypothetical protein
MSSGGQRGIDVSGVTTMRLQTASDVTTRKQLQLTYQTYASTTGANAYMGDLVNATGAYLQFRAGLKEQRDPLVSNATCVACSNAAGQGLPYNLNPTSGYPWTFRNRT